jgi:hypothetical protein
VTQRAFCAAPHSSRSDRRIDLARLYARPRRFPPFCAPRGRNRRPLPRFLIREIAVHQSHVLGFLGVQNGTRLRRQIGSNASQ